MTSSTLPGIVFYDPRAPSKSGWRLHDSILTAGELSKCSHPPQVVFSNSCQAGATAEWSGKYGYEGQAFGIGSAFILAGVKNYIGTFWEVDDEESRLFATIFYQNLLSGLSLGTALLAARHAIIQQKGWNSLTWASYVLYGDPTFTLLSPGRKKHPLFLLLSTLRLLLLSSQSRSAIQLYLPLHFPLHFLPRGRRFSSRLWFVSLGLLFLTASVLFFTPVLQHFHQPQMPGSTQNDHSLPYPE